MANVRLQPPDSFDFKKPDEWQRWKRRFEQFRLASALSSESDERQISTLLYCLGPDAEEVLVSTGITTDERKKYNDVVSKFEQFFKVRKNTIFERARFNRRNQQEGESAEQYITVLFGLAENCDYGEFKDQMIRDRLVVGIRDSTRSERLQMDAELTLEKAMKTIRQREAVHEQQTVLKSGENVIEPGNLDFVKSKRQQSSKFTKPSLAKICGRCGKGPHGRDKCPARELTCHRCQKKGHYQSQCRTKLTASQHSVSSETCIDASFLDVLTANQKVSWTAKPFLNNQIIDFKLDTGAEVTAVSHEVFARLKNVTLQKATRVLLGPARQKLDVLGQFEGHFKHKGEACQQTVFVVKGLKTNLLGLPTIIALKMVSRVNEISDYNLDIPKKFPKVFQGLGTMGEPYSIKLKPDAQPRAIYAPRNVPLPLRGKVQEELSRMQSLGVISPVDQPTSWCAGMVVVPKKNGTVRICVDLKMLNENVLREIHPLPKVDETLALLSGATCFSKLDANSGFWQIPLSADARLLTTFLTPYGRFCFNKLPFGVSCAPELFQKRMINILQGLQGVVCQIDDVLVFGKTRKEHDNRLCAVMRRLESAGVTLNSAKCEFAKDQVQFLGHLVSKAGVQADPQKIAAIVKMKSPNNITELRRFLGMINQCGKFSPNLAEITQPLRVLLSKNCKWHWSQTQVDAYEAVKKEILKPTVLALYDPTAFTKISADASSFGLGAVLLQKQKNVWRPVAFASRAMTETECSYAQIEKEALATTWACEKFSDYVLGKKIVIETDHKPLVPLLSNKRLESLPPRILRFRLRLSRYDYAIEHVPGKLLYTADTLSRSPVSSAELRELSLQEEAELFAAVAVANLPASTQRLDVYKSKQQEDSICSKILKYCQQGWPSKREISTEMKPYWVVRNAFTVKQGLIMYNCRIVVPMSLQKETLQKLHQGHQGGERCRLLAQNSVWWPGLYRDIQETVRQCSVCAKLHTPNKEPMIPSALPEYPWQKLGSDLFELQGKHYLLLVDYFSRYVDIVKLTSTTSGAVISAIKSVFSRHGIPELLISDNGPQYVSKEFEEFAEKYNFKHTTSSPHFPQSNGQAERTVQTVKRLLSRSDDPFLALLMYRATPLPWCGYSPAQLLMGRNIRTNIPQVIEHLIPQLPNQKKFRQDDKKYKQQQKANYDCRHRVRELPLLPDDTKVWVTTDDKHVPGTVSTTADTPRSYFVDTPTGTLRRNRADLNMMLNDANVDEPTHRTARSPVQTRSKTGTQVKPPSRFS